jgi:hypothetical protein
MNFKNRLYKNIEASKIDIDASNIENIYQNIISILINNSINNIINKKQNKNYYLITVYHIDSLYRDNSKDKYELSKK